MTVNTNGNAPDLNKPAAAAVDLEPRFTLRAQDRYSVFALISYRDCLFTRGLHSQVAEVNEAIAEFSNWQVNNLERLKDPDHVHVPVGQAHGAV